MIFKREYTSHPGRIIRSRRIRQPCYDAECLLILQIGYRKYKPPFCSSSEVSYLKFPHSFTAQAPILTAGPA
ncbi:hypothetical protein ELX98_16260 [Escherichia coli]|nr:hypothetical protein ELX98_16260 [Escherichia coli]